MWTHLTFLSSLGSGLALLPSPSPRLGRLPLAGPVGFLRAVRACEARSAGRVRPGSGARILGGWRDAARLAGPPACVAELGAAAYGRALRDGRGRRRDEDARGGAGPAHARGHPPRRTLPTGGQAGGR